MRKTSSRFVKIFGSGYAVPGECVLSGSLDAELKLRPGTIERISGVRQRYFARGEETAAKLAARACRAALSTSGFTWGDIDCLIAASGTMEQAMPCNAALIHQALELGESSMPAFDVNASCLSFLTALDMMSWSLISGKYRRVMIVSADIASCGLDWRHLETSGIFGDGAAAMVVGLTDNDESRILASDMVTLSSGARYCEIPAGGSRFHPSRLDEPMLPLSLFRMNGKAVYRLVSKHLSDFLQRLLTQAGLELDDIQCVVPHQASLLAMQHLQHRLGIPPERLVNIFPDFGNQVAASLPTALHLAIARGQVLRGDRVLLLGTGAGVSIAGMVMVY